jgi:adenylate kinase
MHKYVIMGVQGCGKGTQAKMLAEKLDLVHISVGDIFRWNIGNHTKLGAKIQRIVTSGELVPDSIVEDMMEERIEQHDWNYGFILDGFPRNEGQAAFLMERYDIDAVIQIDVPDDVVTSRIAGRRKCDQCGKDVNVAGMDPEPTTCEACGGHLTQRADDNPEAVARRLRDYHAKTKPVLDLLASKEKVIAVDGTGSPDDVFAGICSALGV